MKKAIELNRVFDDDLSMFLYAVIDKRTNVNISGIMLVKNDVIALESFKNFIEEQKDKIKPYSEYVLRNLGHYNVSSNYITEPIDSYDICSNKDDLEKYWNEVVEICRSEEI